MKKTIALIMTALMLLSLFACAAKSDDASPDAGSSGEPAAQGSADGSEAAAVGYITDDVDHSARDPYEFVYFYTRSSPLSQMMFIAMQDLTERLNFTIVESTGDGDGDKYIQNVEIFATQGVDGFLIDADPTFSERVAEVLEDMDANYVTFINSVKDTDGNVLAPCVLLDGVSAGSTTVQWLYDNYKTYWGDIDTSKIALLDCTFSVVPDLQDRSDGAIAMFKELFPENDLFFTFDSTVGTLDEETAYDGVSAILSSNPDIEYWWIPCVVEMSSRGAARAVETLGISDRVLVTDVGSDALSMEWDSGYDGCWVSCLAISNYLYVGPALTGLIAICDGRATFDTLWADKRAENDPYTMLLVDSQMVTKDTYKAYFKSIADEWGVPSQY
jgi:ABC-type sugar transport system substrate-binding protein